MNCADTRTSGKFQSRVNRLNVRMAKPAAEEHLDADTRRLTTHLGKYDEFIFMFLDYTDVGLENNLAERQIRPEVILWKNPDASGSNRSEQGATTQAVLMSVYRTLEFRLGGLNPTKTSAEALRSYVATGRPPSLPDTDIPDG